MLGLIIAAVGGILGASVGIGATTYNFVKKGGIQVGIPNQNNTDEESNEEEIPVDEEGNPIVHPIEIKEDNQIFHVVKEEEPKSPFKSKEDKHVNGVETVDPQN